MKRIRLTIEWDGACSEYDWAERLSELIERADYSKVTRVVNTELLTNHGTTEVRDIPGISKPRGFWASLWHQTHGDVGLQGHYESVQPPPPLPPEAGLR